MSFEYSKPGKKGLSELAGVSGQGGQCWKVAGIYLKTCGKGAEKGLENGKK